MSWELATATTRYVIDLAAGGAGPVLKDWTGTEPRPWLPEPNPAFLTEADRLPSEYSALGTRHVRGAELIVEHPDGIVGARLTWPEDEVTFTDAVACQCSQLGRSILRDGWPSLLWSRRVDSTMSSPSMP